MKCLLIIVVLVFATGCGTTADGRKSFLGISKYDKDKCTDKQWVLKKRRIVYLRCFK